MARRFIDKPLSLLVGSGIGAALMYLLDPDMGRQRRANAEHAARDAMAHTGDAFGHLHGRADHWLDHLKDRARGLRDRATREARVLIHSAQQSSNQAVDSATSTAKQLGDRAASMWTHSKQSAMNRADELSGKTRGTHGVGAAGVAGGTVGVLLVGAGLMYLFDPRQGAGRRARMRDQAFGLVRKTGRKARGYGRHWSNRLHGLAHETGHCVREMMPATAVEEESAQRRQPAMDATRA